MGRSPCCDKVGLKKGPWIPEEDQKLLAYIDQNGHGSWRLLPAKAGLQRCGKSCRLRWTNYLRPDIKRGKFSLQEEQTIIQLHALLGNRWSTIANHLAKRTDNEIKNYWNTHLKKRLAKMGIDPVTHRQKSNALGLGSSATQSRDTANLSHMAQWESARLEAEARLVRGSKLVMSSTTTSNHRPVGLSSASAHLLNKATLVPPLPPCLDVLKVWEGTRGKPDAGFFASNVGSLESPTSTLHFFDDAFKTPVNNCVENVKTDEVGPKKIAQNELKHLGKRDKSENVTMLHDMTCINDAATFMEGFAELYPHSADDTFSITGILCDNNLDSGCSGSLEDNKKYWNAIC